MIWCCHELQSRLQVQHRSDIAVAVTVAYVSSYSSYLTPSLRTSICHWCCPKKTPPPKKERGSLDHVISELGAKPHGQLLPSNKLVGRALGKGTGGCPRAQAGPCGGAGGRGGGGGVCVCVWVCVCVCVWVLGGGGGGGRKNAEELLDQNRRTP